MRTVIPAKAGISCSDSRAVGQHLAMIKGRAADVFYEGLVAVLDVSYRPRNRCGEEVKLILLNSSSVRLEFDVEIDLRIVAQADACAIEIVKIM